MPEGRTAESILTLFTSRERASSIIGDLEESGGVRALDIMRLSLAFIWADVKQTPIGMLRAVVVGWVLSQSALAFIAPLMMGAMGWSSRGPDARTLIWFVAAVLWGRIIAPFLIGCAVVTITPERRLTACALVAIIGEVALLAFWADAMSRQHRSPMAGPFYWTNLLPCFMLLVGGAVVRRSAIRT